MQLNSLPDEMLLAVLSHLCPRDLLRSARAVCRRWRVLALHPGVWRHCSFDYKQGYDLRTLKLALRLAPCLDTLRLSFVLKKGDACCIGLCNDFLPSLAALLAATSCAVSRMIVSAFSGPLEADVYVNALERQVSLGRLRYVEYNMSRTYAAPTEKLTYGFKVLKAVLASASGADELVVVDCPINGNSQVLKLSPLPGNLKRLTFGYEGKNDGRNDLIQALIKHNASTLTAVRMRLFYRENLWLQLSQCRRLAEVWVPAMDGLEALLKCPNLTTLCLQMFCEGDRLPAGVLAFFRGATGLRHLTIVFGSFKKAFPWSEAITALTESAKSSELTTLTVGVCTEKGYSAEAQVGRNDAIGFLPAYLPHFPHLHTIAVTDRVFTVAFLEAVSAPGAAPSLRVLSTRYAEPCCPLPNASKTQAPRARPCYLAVVHAALRRNPRLHLQGLNAEHECRPWAWEPCPCCALRLHQGPPALRPRPSILSHERAWWRPDDIYTQCPQAQTTRPWLPPEDLKECECRCCYRLRFPAVLSAYYAHDGTHSCDLHDQAFQWVKVPADE